mmetsp:Transcript_119515/g.230559  ORF Transcript_119515/g.230559 Transcript_119515/m.230559 type:complete len:253 (-) Transcript_119515:637-1395(-)
MRIHGIRNIDHEVNLATTQQCQSIGLTLHKRLVNENARLQAFFGPQLLVCVLRGVQLQAHVAVEPGVVCKLELLCGGPNAHQHIFGWQLEASCNHSFEKRLILVHTETCHLPCGLHFNTQAWVRVLQATERKDRDLAGYVVHVNWLDGHRPHRDTKHHPRGKINEVDIVRFGDEWHGPGRTEVALDDLHFVLFADELYVERARDLQGTTDLLTNHFHPPVGLHEKLLCRQEKSSIATVDSCILDMLSNGIIQ